jgi:hypothetical protein
LSHRVSFQKGDFMKLSETFGENSFDASEPSAKSLGYLNSCQSMLLRLLVTLLPSRVFTERSTSA